METYIHVYSRGHGDGEVRHVEVISERGRYGLEYFQAPLCHLAEDYAEKVAAIIDATVIRHTSRRPKD